MEVEKVHKLLKVIALAEAKPDDSEELAALRNVSLALIYIADAIAEMQKINQGRPSPAACRDRRRV